ncbi:hypothetical protein F2P81_020586 [Scophthalmus maximus]|uniref:Uncharacterized protein n=1 Tax=Scophthalmus maximus TaxID=52904 RepID=A0A6A4S6H7_SCOMX|nr:hypothetical protein F2P81_020586 [Scophthalmus maximus]
MELTGRPSELLRFSLDDVSADCFHRSNTPGDDDPFPGAEPQTQRSRERCGGTDEREAAFTSDPSPSSLSLSVSPEDEQDVRAAHGVSWDGTPGGGRGGFSLHCSFRRFSLTLVASFTGNTTDQSLLKSGKDETIDASRETVNVTERMKENLI